jgi:RNase P subunit RPR2
MSCCRRGAKFPRTRPNQNTACANCHRSLRTEAAAAIGKKSMEVQIRGLVSFTAVISCECGFTNRIPLTFTKR